MPKTRPAYPSEFRRQMVDFVRPCEPSAQAVRNGVVEADLDRPGTLRAPRPRPPCGRRLGEPLRLQVRTHPVMIAVDGLAPFDEA